MRAGESSTEDDPTLTDDAVPPDKEGTKAMAPSGSFKEILKSGTEDDDPIGDRSGQAQGLSGVVNDSSSASCISINDGGSRVHAETTEVGNRKRGQPRGGSKPTKSSIRRRYLK
jgi:hypothetical protein